MPQPGFKLALIAVVLVFFVILLGAWTRLVDAGLGCPDWPGCYGQLTVPQSATDIQRAQALYPDNPVEAFKAHAEMTHRYAAGTLGLLVLILGIIAIRARHVANYPIGLIAGLVILIVCQAAAGALTVTWRLWPQVVAMHLAGGFISAGLLVLLAIRLSGWRPSRPLVIASRLRAAKVLTSLGLLLLFGQILLGSWVSSNYAALACPDLPTCQTQWWPPADFAAGFNIKQEIGPNYLGGQLQSEARTAIHLTHRIGALILTLYLVALLTFLSLSGLSCKWTLGVLTILGVQFSLGIANILLLLPVGIATAHNGFAALLFVVMLALGDCLRRPTDMETQF